MPIDLPRAIFALLLFATLTPPLALGAVDPWVWSAQGLLVGTLLVAWGCHVAVGHAAPVAFRRTALPTALFAAALAWAALQAVAFTPASWHHPVWHLAAESLGDGSAGRTAASIGGAISVNPAETWNAIFRLAAYGAIFHLSLNLCRDRGRARMLVQAVALAVTLYAAYGLAAHLSGAERILWMEKTSYRGDLTATFVNRNTFAAFAGVGLICLTALLLDGAARVMPEGLPPIERKRRLVEFLTGPGLLLIGGTFVTASALVLTHSRAGLACTLAGLIVLLLTFAAKGRLRMRHALLWLAAGTASIGVILGFGGQRLLDRLLQTGDHAAARMDIYRQTLHAIGDSPWLGTGFGTFADAFRLYRTQEIPHPFSEAHNTYLETVMELGLPAGIVLIAAVGSLAILCVLGLIRRRRGLLTPAVGLATSVLLGLHALVDFSLQNPSVASLYALILGGACAHCWRNRIDTSR